MKKLMALMMAMALMISAFTALADTEITVNGTGETLLPADTAVVTLGVNVRNADVVKAQSEVNDKIEAIRSNLVKEGFSEENINTDRLRIYAVYDYSSEVEKIVAYNASSYLAIRTKDMENVGKIIDIAFEAGANMLDGISFSAEDVDEACQNSLTEAIKEARAKAQVIAAAAGLEITDILAINEGYTTSYDSGVNTFYRSTSKTEQAAEDCAGGTLVQAAKVNVTATVTIVFAAK